MKKFLFILSVLITTLSFAACNSECVHEYGEWTVVKAATCSEEGVHIRVCSLCSAEEVLTVPNALHAEIIDPEVLPTCEIDGLTEGKHCDLCGQILIAQEPIDATGHNYVIEDIVEEPTCFVEGKGVKICDLCGYEEYYSIDKTSHTEITRKGYPATCKKEGLTDGVNCGLCGEVIVEQTKIEKVDHYIDVDKGFPSTCQKRGVSDGEVCRYCGKIFTEKVILPLADHTPVTDKGYPATETSEGLTDGEHCSVCDTVLIPQKIIARLGSNGLSFASGYVTKKQTVISTKHLNIKVDANVFVPDNMVEIVDVFTTAIEELSGLSFKGNPNYVIAPIIVQVIKDNSVEREVGSAFGGAFGAVVSPLDIIDCSTLVHESLHALHFDQSEWFYNTWAMEGITTYTKYKLRLYIEENYPDLVEYIGTHNNNVTNYKILDYDLLYAHPMDYWIDNVLEGPNNNYSIGFRLMWFLDQTYGNYTKWITEFEESYPKYVHSPYDDRLPKEKQLEAFYMVYGEDVFDRFYAWLKENEDICSEYRPIDLRGAKAFNTYPSFYYSWNEWKLWSIHTEGILYNDLYIGLDAGQKYLTEYKHKTLGKLTLTVNDGVTVKLFSADGKVIKTVDGSSGPIDLTGVSYIQLVGEGRLDRFEIKGYK